MKWLLYILSVLFGGMVVEIAKPAGGANGEVAPARATSFIWLNVVGLVSSDIDLACV